MRYRSTINRTKLGTEEVKELELDEQPRPTRKVDEPLVPSTDSGTTLRHKRIKGKIKIK